MKVAVLVAAVFVVAAARPDGPVAQRACRGADLGGSFTVVRGSAGAGQITYRLRVVNRSGRVCTVSGIPRVRLLDRNGRALPTDARPAPPPRPKPLIVLARGGAAGLTARFSPDVPGVGEPRAGRLCEPRALRLRVAAPGGGSVVVPLSPPTPVCEHGRMFLTPFARLS